MVEAEAQFRRAFGHLAGLPDGSERQRYELDLQTSLSTTGS
jgi:hypothetical protein